MPAQPSGQTVGKNYLVFHDFETMDTQSVRVGLAPNRLAWLENLMPIGPNYLYTVPAALAPLTTITGKSITRLFFVNIASTDFEICFTADGAGVAVNLANGVQTQFATAGTFSAAPDCTQWQSARILIADSTAGYCTWDTSAFVSSGGVSPVINVTNGGTGYSATPTITITGGSGSGATATATVVGGVITAITLTNAGTGYKTGDTLGVTITDGTGVNATATAHIWPILTGKFTTLAVYSGRVWLAGNRFLQYTGTGGFDDFAGANASASLTISDADLVHQITALRSLNNYLWIFGDNSIKQIGTISVSGSTTNFTIVTLSSDTGTTFPLSIASYNRLVLFANKTGVWAVLGASVQKISGQMDGVFQNLNYSLPLQAAVNDIGSSGIGGGSIRCYLLLASYVDPVQGITRSVIMAFFQNKWFIVNQGIGLQAMSSAVVAGSYETFASSGADLTQIIQNPAAAVAILVRTALAHDGKPHMGKRVMRVAVLQVSNSTGPMTMTLDSELGTQPANYTVGFPITWLNNMGQQINWQNNGGNGIVFQGKGTQFQRVAAENSGIYLGLTLSGMFSQMSLNNMIIEYGDGPVLVSQPGA